MGFVGCNKDFVKQNRIRQTRVSQFFVFLLVAIFRFD